jgi:RNA polymerase sigma-70 factor (family 1)
MDFSTHTDSQLLDLFHHGDEKAFNEIYHRYWKYLFRLSLNILHEESLAKDVVQEVFVDFYQKSSSRSILHLQGYLFQCTRLQCFMQLRSGKISQKHLERMHHVQAAANEVEENFDARELQHVLESKMATLPEKCREVFYLSRIELLPNKKIAEQLNISHKTVENQITKALKVLRASVEKMTVFALLLLF